jgi:hypothetical protein
MTVGDEGVVRMNRGHDLRPEVVQSVLRLTRLVFGPATASDGGTRLMKPPDHETIQNAKTNAGR